MTIKQSFYNLKYGSSIITSKVSKIISVMKTKALVLLLSSRQKMNENAKNELFLKYHFSGNTSVCLNY